MTKKEAQDIAVKFVHDVYRRQMEQDTTVLATIANHAAKLRQTGDCTFFIVQLKDIRKFIDDLIKAMENNL